MKSISKKLLCIGVALTMMFSAAAEAAVTDSAITSLNIDDSGEIAMTVTKSSEESGRGIVAVYDANGQLKGLAISEETDGTGDKSLVFNDLLDTDGGTVKAFFWETKDGAMTLKPLSNAFVSEIQETPTAAPTSEPVTEGFTATFETDAHASITVSDTQDFTDAAENVTKAYARNSDTGEIDTSGNGQVNFKVVVDDGYEVDSVTVAPSNYKNLKLPSELGENTYRITKITGDITVTVTTKQTSSDPTSAPTSEPVTEGFTATFETDAHASITVSDTQDFTDAAENVTKAYARNSDTGEIDTSGNGQVNFKVVVDDGYEVDSVTVAPSNYKNLKLPSELGENTYRITKITGDITVTVTTKQAAEPTSSPTADPDSTPAPGDGIIHLLGDSINADGVENVTVDGTTVTITAAGDYIVEGTLDDGQIAVNSAAKSDVVTIALDGVSVTNTSGNAFNGLCGKVSLVPSGENTFVSSASSGDTTAVYSKNDLTIKGDSEDSLLTAVSEYGNGIRCKNDIEIGTGNVSVTAANNGIKGDQSVKITKKNTSVTVVSGGDGIKSDQEPEIDASTNEYVSGGTVTVNGGSINITANSTTESDGTVSNGDGIQADTLLTIAGGTITINAAGEAIKANASSVAYLEDTSLTSGTPAEGDGCVEITGGTIVAAAGEDGIKAVKNVTVSGGNVTITKAEEGIQVNEVIYDTDGTTVIGYVDGEIDINGGTLDITCSEDGIQCGTGDVVITDGSITVNSQQDCIQSENITNISGGTFDLTAYGGAPATVSDQNPEAANSCKGVKAVNLVYISGGTFNINTYDDAVHSNNTVRITGGSVTAATGDDGVHGDSYLYISDNADINITKSYEGIEAAKIYVQGGETRIVSSDDGANAAGDEPTEGAYDLDAVLASASAELFAGPGGNTPGSNPGGNTGPNWGGEDTSSYGYLEVSGGLLYIEAEGDGFDTNGSGLISGGTVLVNGPTSGGNGVFDIGDSSSDTLTITGGTVIGAGTSDMAVTPNNSKQYYVVTSSGQSMGSQGLSSQSAGKAFKLTNSSGTEIVTYVPSKSYSWVFISTPEMTSGSYTLNYGGSVTGGTVTGKGSYGIVTGGSYSGSSSCTLTAASK